MKNINDQRRRQKTIKKRNLIEGAYTLALASDIGEMAKHLAIPEKVLRRWRQTGENGNVEGWLSHPVTKQEYITILIIANYVWGHDELIRFQLSKKTMAQRLKLTRCADKTWIERVVLEDLIRRKLLGKKRYLTWEYYRGELRAHYPLGYKQLTWDILQRMQQAARDAIRDHKKAGTIELLIKSVGLKYINGRAERPAPRLTAKASIASAIDSYESNIPEEFDY